MAYSMTGFGRAEWCDEEFRATIEVKSINHRYQEFYIRNPRHLSYLEPTIRNHMAQHGGRGKFEITFELGYLEDAQYEILVNLPLAKSYFNAYDEISKYLNIENHHFLNLILQKNEVVEVHHKDMDPEKAQQLLIRVLTEALEELWAMRSTEGALLTREIQARLKTIRSHVNTIKNKSDGIVETYREKLRERILQILGDGVPLNEDRLENELAYYADKMNIEEEINRLISHEIQFSNTLILDEPVGRKLDFIIQEMNREVNTIGSKANDEAIGKLVIELKAEIEKIREQVQNLL